MAEPIKNRIPQIMWLLTFFAGLLTMANTAVLIAIIAYLFGTGAGG